MPAGRPHDECRTQTTRDIIREPFRPPMSTDDTRRIVKHYLLAASACLAMSPAVAQLGAITAPCNLDDPTDGAQDIIRGTVTDARVEKHPELDNLHTIVVTLRVHETLKGAVRETYTF